ncbi:hypothetical protein NUW54_g8940 [Trametes sanguinea]|uniref:Uncharacterized protein n=1 Tax=Trametes sanguinea TaxID=158606 RepID=A0ACC1P9T1_9APHY|nr:hypothetical protein NUW54_g8940 [Trametes sanguinea]
MTPSRTRSTQPSKYARVDSSASAFAGREGAYIDAGLALGRSFRVGWGPGGTLVHLGELCGPNTSPTSRKSSANVSTVKLSTVPLISGVATDASAQASRLLSHHLSNTVIEEDADGVPFANPSPKLTFASFVSQFPSTDQSFEPTLFRLGHALFDPIDFRLDDIPDVQYRHRIAAIRRKTELSKWLRTAVASTCHLLSGYQAYEGESSVTLAQASSAIVVTAPNPPSKDVKRDEELTWDQVSKARTSFLSYAKGYGWKAEHLEMFSIFFICLDAHPIRNEPKGNETVIQYQAHFRPTRL